MRILLVAVILFCSTFTYSQTTSSKQAQILKMIELAGTKRVMETVKLTMKESFKKSYPDKDQKFWDDFFNEMSTESLINMIIPIYDKHFTEEDINGLVKFYESPIGKKLTEKLPVITQESMMVGQKWGMEIGQKLQNKIRESEN